MQGKAKLAPPRPTGAPRRLHPSACIRGEGVRAAGAGSRRNQNRSRTKASCRSLDPHQRGPNSLRADRSTRHIIGPHRKATLAISRLCVGSRGRTTGPIGQTTGTFVRCPTRLPAGIPPRIPTASTQHMPPTNALRHTACITPETRAQVPVQRHYPRCLKGNSGPHLFSSWKHAYASPRCVCPTPCVAWRCRAADYACCTSMTTTASAAACLVQIPHALTMQCAVNTWSTPPQIRVTGIAAAGVSRTPAISTADALHAFAFCISPTAGHACKLPHSLPGHVQAFAVHLNSKPRKK